MLAPGTDGAVLPVVPSTVPWLAQYAHFLEEALRSDHQNHYFSHGRWLVGGNE